MVTYYDFRNDTNTPAGLEGTDYFAVPGLAGTGGRRRPTRRISSAGTLLGGGRRTTSRRPRNSLRMRLPPPVAGGYRLPAGLGVGW